MSADGLYPNGTTASGPHDQEMNPALFEVRVLNIVVFSLALVVLASTSLYCITVCYNRSRQMKRAQVYESAVAQNDSSDPVAIKAVKRTTSFINPLAFFRKSEEAKNNSKIYYIYTNPLPVGLKEEEEEERTKAPKEVLLLPLAYQEYTKDPESGVLLDPPIFYMQL